MVDFLKGKEKFYKIIIVLVDLALINLAYVLAFLIKFNWSLPEYNFTPYLEAMPFITIAALIFFDIYGLLKFYGKTVYDAVISVIFVVILLAITTVAITYFKQGFSFPRSVLIMAPILQFFLLSVWKVFLLKIRRYIAGTKKVMIIGSIGERNLVIEKVKMSMKHENADIKYIFDSTEEDAIFKRIDNMDEVFICADVPGSLKMKIISRCMGSRQVIYVIPQLFEISLSNSKLTQFDDVPAFMIGKLDLSIEQKFFKRGFDVVFSLFGIIITLPIMLAVALLVRLTSPGPAIFTQERVTMGNRVFKVYKFRTMYDGAESKTGPVLSGVNDPRVTAVGRFLRKTRLDELPQLFNVLKGDMSLVGPRPERPYFVEQLCKDMPEYRNRYVIRAGITGFAQVLGSYDTSPEDKLRYDLMYIKNYSLILDIKLILQTFKVVFSGNKIHEKSLQGDSRIYYMFDGANGKGRTL
jgi:exopolysaccharide biosynthesis polyprenyl glycosylphosphotransferase